MPVKWHIYWAYGCWIAENNLGYQVWSVTKNQLMKAIGAKR